MAYIVNTEPGSSGSPCFTTDWQLVALHCGTAGEGLHNLGIRASHILESSKFDWPDEPIVALPSGPVLTPGSLSMNPSEGLNPAALVVRFVLKKGEPVWSHDEDGWVFTLSLEPKPDDSEIRVTHTLRDYWGEGKHETFSANWNVGFQRDFSSYGDLSIVSSIKDRGKTVKIQTWLSDSLRRAHAAEWNDKIQKAIDDLRQH